MIRTLLRPLPLSIAAMLLLGLVKLTSLVQVLGPTLATAGATAGRSVLPSARAADTAHAPAASAAAAAAVAAAAPPPAAAPAPAPAPVSIKPEPPPAPPGPSEAERALLLDLRARREALETRERSLESRDSLQKAAEKGLSDRLDQLTALQARLETLDKARRDRDEANWTGLVKTYETMRPRDAATIFNDLDQTVLLPVLDRMKETKAAPILAAMQPDRARAATAHLAEWRTRANGGPKE